MPIPFRLKDEEEQVFLDRCMNESLMKSEFPDLNDRLQICSVQSRYEETPSPAPGLSRLRVGFRQSGSQKVDASEGIMTDISLIEVGDARGHDLFIDEKSLESAIEVIGDNLPAYITHEGALDDDRILREVGVFSEFFIDGEKLKAKKFKALESFRDDEKIRFNRLFDIASEMPDTFGVSLVFEASIFYIMKDGKEIPADEITTKEADEIIREFPSVRFHSIKSADFVDAPASNRKGLFSNQTNSRNMTENENQTEEEIVEDKLDETPIEETPEETPEENSVDQRISDLESRISAQDEIISKLNGELSDANKVNETLSSLIEGEDVLSEPVSEEVESVSILDQFTQAEGAEATRLFKKHRKEIRSSFNSLKS